MEKSDITGKRLRWVIVDSEGKYQSIASYYGFSGYTKNNVHIIEEKIIMDMFKSNILTSFILENFDFSKFETFNDYFEYSTKRENGSIMYEQDIYFNENTDNKSSSATDFILRNWKRSLSKYKDKDGYGNTRIKTDVWFYSSLLH